MLIENIIFKNRFQTMLQCWEENPNKRPTFTELLSNLNLCAGMWHQNYFTICYQIVIVFK